MATVLITGANRGIGLELCKLYGSRGDRVLGVCRQSSPHLTATPGVEALEGIDVGDDGCIPLLRKAVGDQMLDVVINNAGVLPVDSLDQMDFAAARRAYDVNSLGPLRVTVALRANLQLGSRVAIVTSRVGSIADNSSGRLYAYRMSKAAVNMAGVNLAHELRPAGVAVLLLHPGMVATDMTGGNGVSPVESARNLVDRIDGLTLELSGKFFHANGQELPW
jgi:NAD(P)-dependent dehydrogenase (short-subunit alcohol dehydrogenase family)